METYDKTIDLYGDGIGKVQYIQHLGDDKTIVNSARVSFGKDNNIPIDDKDKKLIRYLMKNKHTSVLEHNVLTCKFIVPLFVRSQHHRHRTWSFNEISRRYTSENLEFYCPQTFRSQHEKERQVSNNDEINPVITSWFDDGYPMSAKEAIKTHVEHSITLFNTLLSNGVCREQARMVLPQNLYTEYYATVNLNNLLKFIILRDDAHAQMEIQRVGQAVRQIATDLWPEAMTAFNELLVK